jgi:hypothetical protein
MGAQLSLFVMIASNDSFAVISNGWERCSFASRLRLVFGYDSRRPALHPLGAALRAFKFAPGKFVEPEGSEPNPHYPDLLMNGLTHSFIQ